MTETRSFWAWHRVGLPSSLTARPAAGATRAAIPARLTMDTAGTADVPVDLMGPGDVGGIEQGQIRRTEPVDGCADFEPAMFPYVELRDADLPWRFTPEGPVASSLPDPEHPGAVVPQQRLQPWCALVVLPLDDAVLVAPAGASTARLTCDAALLPDPTQAWAWAHVHLTGQSGVADSAALLDPQRSFARVVCPIRLEADRQYVACLVPTYAVGVAAAGLPPRAGDPLGPAWGGTGPVTLPVYHSWSFGTAAAGTFETLARRLRPRLAPAEAGGVAVRIDAAGWGADATPGSAMSVQGAVRPLSTAADPAADVAFAVALAHAVSAEGPGLQLRPPLYGQDHASGTTTVAADDGWFAQLNTDARRRTAAGLAAWAVLVDQDELVDRAWDQLSTAQPETVGPASAEVAAAVTGSISDRHLGAVAGRGATLAVARRMMRPGGPLARQGRVPLRPTTASLAPALDPTLTPPTPTPATPTPATPSQPSPGGDAAPTGAPAAAPTGAPAAAPTAAPTAAPAAAPTAAPTPPAAAVPGLFRPSFDDAAFGLLRSTSHQWVLPGLDGIPLDSVVLMRTNPTFVEAFLVGLDHALGRELQWRRFPLDPSGTMFRTFWPTAGSPPQPAMQPIDEWDPTSSLGSHVGEADQLVVVLRGSLIRRYPTTTIYLSGQVPGGPEEHVAAAFEASIGPDTTLVGFPRSIDDLGTGPTGQVWSVVLQEAVQHPRFGLDDAPADGTSATVVTWQDLDWANPHVAGHLHVPIDGPLLGVGRPTGSTTALGAPPAAVWGTDSAAVAGALTRAPVRVRIPVSLWLLDSTG